MSAIDELKKKPIDVLLAEIFEANEGVRPAVFAKNTLAALDQIGWKIVRK